ncbi:hypothetical protein I6J77_09885 [Rhodanobacter sp. FDAARGOS 1247]|uniref:hypothetical protein n=1 Tax=Rhodanobacter sp. FDAARGOS 1247 TaxID=2778082 RepID=UPI00195139EA|nr:hypothetical protein [Rhodanobacter sp. FDAARGOS 1247]QRP62464.1 hypothetical protein I6J77_09885 [Rhodanobacter sp. FDAARGOS 1247]
MRKIIRCLVWVCLLLLQFGPTEYAHADTPAKPLLDGMSVVQVSLGVLRPKLGDGAVGAVNFDPASGVWQFRLDRGQGSVTPTLEITLDESTGEVCAQDPVSGQCVARGSAAAKLKQARDERVAQEDAVRRPAPDLQGVMIALVRYQVQAKDGYLRANSMPLYVSLSWPDGSRSIDLSEDSIRQLADTGVELFPASALTASRRDAREKPWMQMGVGLPMRRQDGNYEVMYGFYCGPLCASSHTAVLRHDAEGWHVLTSTMNTIS